MENKKVKHIEVNGITYDVPTELDLTEIGFSQEESDAYNKFCEDSLVEAKNVMNEVATNVKDNWSYRFYMNDKLYKLKVDCSSATNMNASFYRCDNITELILKNTQNVTNFRDIIAYCRALEKVVMDCQSATSLDLLTYYDSALKYIDIGSVENCSSFANAFSSAVFADMIKMKKWGKGNIVFQSRWLSKNTIKYIVFHAKNITDGAVNRALQLTYEDVKSNWNAIANTKPTQADCEILGVADFDRYGDLTWAQIASTIKDITIS